MKGADKESVGSLFIMLISEERWMPKVVVNIEVSFDGEFRGRRISLNVLPF